MTEGNVAGAVKPSGSAEFDAAKYKQLCDYVKEKRAIAKAKEDFRENTRKGAKLIRDMEKKLQARENELASDTIPENLPGVEEE